MIRVGRGGSQVVGAMFFIDPVAGCSVAGARRRALMDFKTRRFLTSNFYWHGLPSG